MDHLGTPMREGVNFVHNALIGINARDRIRIGAAGKIATNMEASLSVPTATSVRNIPVKQLKFADGSAAKVANFNFTR